MNDIFFDTNLAHNLINPTSPEYRDFLNWLYKDGALVISNKLEVEYGRGNQNLIVIIDGLTKNGRINRITNRQLQEYCIPKRIENRLLSNKADRNNIKCIVLSNRKMGIIADNNLLKDINNYPRLNKIKPTAANRPSEIDYK